MYGYTIGYFEEKKGIEDKEFRGVVNSDLIFVSDEQAREDADNLVRRVQDMDLDSIDDGPLYDLFGAA